MPRINKDCTKEQKMRDAYNESARLGVNEASAPSEFQGCDTPVYVVARSAKTRGVYVVLALFLGCLGVHNFYADRIGVGVAQLLITLLLGWLIIPWIAVALWCVIEACVVTADARGVEFS